MFGTMSNEVPAVAAVSPRRSPRLKFSAMKYPAPPCREKEVLLMLAPPVETLAKLNDSIPSANMSLRLLANEADTHAMKSVVTNMVFFILIAPVCALDLV